MNNQNSPPYKIILAIDSSFLQDLMRRVLINQDDFQIAGEVTDWNRLIELLEKTTLHWVIISLTSDGNIPQEVDQIFSANPNVGVLAISHDGRQIKSRWVESHKKKIPNLSPLKLEEVLSAIRQHFNQKTAKIE